MGSKYVKCNEQEYPDGPRCNAVFTADNERDLLEAAGRHGINVHGHSNTAAFRNQMRGMIKEGMPPE